VYNRYKLWYNEFQKKVFTRSSFEKIKIAMAEHSIQCCIICGVGDSDLCECRDVSSWETFLHAAQIRGHKKLLDVTFGENGLPEFPVRCHRSCRATFSHKKDLLKLSKAHPKQLSEPLPQQHSSQ
jgi:hypothetical protein